MSVRQTCICAASCKAGLPWLIDRTQFLGTKNNNYYPTLYLKPGWCGDEIRMLTARAPNRWVHSGDYWSEPQQCGVRSPGRQAVFSFSLLSEQLSKLVNSKCIGVHYQNTSGDRAGLQASVFYISLLNTGLGLTEPRIREIG